MTEKNPRVTVLMPVYNGEKYLREALESVLGQTFRDYEFLIVNDGSTDRSVDIITSYRDPRIRLEHNQVNSGLVFSLNKGLALATGEYIARMDCDDISLPMRLGRQVAFLDAHPEIGGCGTWFRKFGALNTVVRWREAPERVRCGFIFGSMLSHPTVMFRRALFEKHDLRYSPEYVHAEDYELWVRALHHMNLANLGEVLLLYRVHSQQVTERLSDEQIQSAGKVRLTLLNELGIKPTDEELALHQIVSTCRFNVGDDIIARADAWLCRLKAANDQRRVYPEPAFSATLVEHWITMCKKSFDQGIRSWRQFLCPRIFKNTGMGWGYLVRHLRHRVAGKV